MKYLTLKIVVTYVKCDECGFKRKIYFFPGFLYGARIVTNKSGSKYAYANLLKENIIPELKEICQKVFNEEKLTLSKHFIDKVISSLYEVTCDPIDNEKIVTTSIHECVNCKNSKVEQDKEFGEKLLELQMPYVTHECWGNMPEQQKIFIVREKMIEQGFV